MLTVRRTIEKSRSRTLVDETYDAITARGDAAVTDSRIVTDPFLVDPSADRRTGLSVVARPDAELRDRLVGMAKHLNSLEPGQFPYGAENIHVTVLNLLETMEPRADRSVLIDRFTPIVETMIAGCGPFAIRFSGVLLAPDCVLVKGYPMGSGLENLRNSLRREVRASGLDHLVETGYRHVTAHSTIFRFRTQPADPTRFRARIADLADTDLGRCTIATIQLIEHDWYLSASRTRVVAEFLLR